MLNSCLKFSKRRHEIGMLDHAKHNLRLDSKIYLDRILATLNLPVCLPQWLWYLREALPLRALPVSDQLWTICERWWKKRKRQRSARRCRHLKCKWCREEVGTKSVHLNFVPSVHFSRGRASDKWRMATNKVEMRVCRKYPVWWICTPQTEYFTLESMQPTFVTSGVDVEKIVWPPGPEN